MKLNFRRCPSSALVNFLCALFFLTVQTHGQEPPNVERFRQLTKKSQAGEALTADEQAFMERVRADIQRRRGQPGAPVPVQRPAEGGSATMGTWEELPDGSQGQETEFEGVGGIAIPAYVRKPKGDGPFPVIVLLHGGKYSKGATMGLGRSMQSPTADFVEAGWAVYSKKDPAKYGYSSAFTEAADVRAPILVINSRNDDNSPPSVIDAYVAKLRAAGKQVDPSQIIYHPNP